MRNIPKNAWRLEKIVSDVPDKYAHIGVHCIPGIGAVDEEGHEVRGRGVVSTYTIQEALMGACHRQTTSMC